MTPLADVESVWATGPRSLLRLMCSTAFHTLVGRMRSSTTGFRSWTPVVNVHRPTPASTIK